MKKSTEETVKCVMADILELDQNLINQKASMENIASWDSLNHIKLVVALEAEFGISFEVSDMESMLSLYDILLHVEKKLVN